MIYLKPPKKKKKWGFKKVHVNVYFKSFKVLPYIYTIYIIYDNIDS